MRNALWIDKKMPSDEQMEEIEQLGYGLLIDKNCLKECGQASINTEEQLDKYFDKLNETMLKHQAEAVFGGFNNAIFGGMYQRRKQDGVPVYASWNTLQWKGGVKPIYWHRKFVQVGEI